MTDARRLPRLGRVLPLVLLAFATLDIGLRLVPARYFAFRAWEALSRYPAPGAPLEASARFESSRTHGDLITMLGLRWLLTHSVRRRSEVFTTDRYGFRNADSVSATGPVDVIAVGSSFTASLGVADQDTFPARIAELSNRKVYNAGGMAPSMRTIDLTRHRLRMANGTVVQELVEINDPPPTDVLNRPIPCDGITGSVARVACMAGVRIEEFRVYSPLHAFLRRLRWTVSPASAEYRLANGDTLLLRPDLLTAPPMKRPTESAVRLLRRMADEYRARQLRFILVLVPNKETVYGPLLARPSMPAAAADDYLTRLERDVRSVGIETVNVAPLLRAFATAHLGDRQYVYLRDDTHWNACGISLAAQAVTATLAPGTVDQPAAKSPGCVVAP